MSQKVIPFNSSLFLRTYHNGSSTSNHLLSEGLSSRTSSLKHFGITETVPWKELLPNPPAPTFSKGGNYLFIVLRLSKLLPAINEGATPSKSLPSSLFQREVKERI